MNEKTNETMDTAVELTDAELEQASGGGFVLMGVLRCYFVLGSTPKYDYQRAIYLSLCANGGLDEYCSNCKCRDSFNGTTGCMDIAYTHCTDANGNPVHVGHKF